MKATTKFRLYKAWMMAATALPVCLLMAILIITAPIQVLFNQLCEWRNRRISKKLKALRLGLYYNCKTKENIIKEIEEDELL